jgi:hypothetical protein
MSESLIMPEAIKIIDILRGKKHVNELKFMPPANNTVAKQIREICDDTCEQLLEKNEKSPTFTTQFDDSTNTSNFGQPPMYHA